LVEFWGFSASENHFSRKPASDVPSLHVNEDPRDEFAIFPDGPLPRAASDLRTVAPSNIKGFAPRHAPDVSTPSMLPLAGFQRLSLDSDPDVSAPQKKKKTADNSLG